MKCLKISDDHRRIVTFNDESFFLIGDTAWELFHKLDRDDAEYYLKTRKNQGFNFIQAVVLAELNGLETPNPYGRTPLLKNESGNFDPTMPDIDGDYSYFDHVEFIISKASELGLYMGILPTWGDKFNKKWGLGPEIFTEKNAYIYAKWLAMHLSKYNNIIWILGGDRPLETQAHFSIIESMAQGLKDGDGGKFLITLHPSGSASSSKYVHSCQWLDFNMIQSGHCRPSNPESYELLAYDRTLQPIKPTMDGEQRYEDHPISFKETNGYFDAVDVRNAMWKNLFSGSCGNTYGHSCVWCMNTEKNSYHPNTWRESLHRPAAEQMKYFSDFICKNDLSSHKPSEAAVENNEKGENYVQAVISKNSAYLYIPCGISVKLSNIPFKIDNITAFEPTTGEYHSNISLTDGIVSFPRRGAGRGMDIVVILKGE